MTKKDKKSLRTAIAQQKLKLAELTYKRNEVLSELRKLETELADSNLKPLQFNKLPVPPVPTETVHYC